MNWRVEAVNSEVEMATGAGDVKRVHKQDGMHMWQEDPTHRNLACKA